METQQPITPKRGSNKAITGIISIVAIVGLIFGISKFKNSSETQPTTDSTTGNTTTSSNSSNTSTSASASSSEYKDGTYSADGNYNSPGGKETVGVSLTLKDGVVTAAEMTSKATLPQSKQYQSLFMSGFKSQVIGKDISTLSLTKVSGSSLTPKGFNDAVAKIRVEAEA